MKCTHCGAPVRERVAFCTYCGVRLPEDAPPQPAAPRAAAPPPLHQKPVPDPRSDVFVRNHVERMARTHNRIGKGFLVVTLCFLLFFGVMASLMLSGGPVRRAHRDAMPVEVEVPTPFGGRPVRVVPPTRGQGTTRTRVYPDGRRTKELVLPDGKVIIIEDSRRR